MSTRFDAACTAAAAGLIECITSGEAGEWTVPWHAPGGLVAPQNAATGNVYHIGALGIFQIHECTRLAPWRELDRPHIMGQSTLSRMPVIGRVEALCVAADIERPAMAALWRRITTVCG